MIFKVFAPEVAITQDYLGVLSLAHRVAPTTEIEISLTKTSTHTRRYIMSVWDMDATKRYTVKGYISPTDAGKFNAVGENNFGVTIENIGGVDYKKYHISAPIITYKDGDFTEIKPVSIAPIDTYLLFTTNKLEAKEDGITEWNAVVADKVRFSSTQGTEVFDTKGLWLYISEYLNKDWK